MIDNKQLKYTGIRFILIIGDFCLKEYKNKAVIAGFVQLATNFCKQFLYLVRELEYRKLIINVSACTIIIPQIFIRQQC